MNQVGESGVVKRVGSEAELQSKGSVRTRILQILAALHNQFGAIRAFFRCNWAIGSIAGVSDVGAPLPYGGAKALLANYVQGLARRVGADGIRANVVEPGNIVFDGGNWERRERADPMSVQSMLDAKVPLRVSDVRMKSPMR